MKDESAQESKIEKKRNNLTNGFRQIAPKFLIGLILTLVISGSAVFAQENENTADRALKGGGRVNPSTLAMEISIPLGSYPGRGINVPISLSYSSKVWRMDSLQQTSTSVGGSPCFTVSEPRYGEKSAAGWTTSLETPYIEYSGWTDRYTTEGFPYLNRTCESIQPPQQALPIRRITLYLPSGETHELRMDAGINSQGNTDRNGYYYAADGSNIVYYENSSTNTYKLMMPDGSAYELETLPSPASVAERKAVKFTDRNGNFTSYNPTTKVWTDTLGRTLTAPFGTSAPPAAEIKTYQMPGMTGEYKFHWKKLEDGLANPADQLKYPGDVYDSGTSGVVHTQRPAADTLFHSNDLSDNQVRNSVQLFNPVVLTKIELPTGQSYEFSYDVFGQINKIKYPTGGEETFTYQPVLPLTPAVQYWSDVSSQTNRGVQTRKLYKTTGAAPYQWTYSTDYAAPQGYKISIINPADILTETFLHRGIPCQNCTTGDFGFNDTLIGRAYETRVFDASGGGGARKLVSRNMTHWTKNSYPVLSGSADWHPRVTHDEGYIYEPSGNGDHVKSTVKYEYEDLSTIDKPLLRKKTSEYAFEAVPGSSSADPLPEAGENPDGNPVPMATPTPPTLLRTTEQTFLIYDPAVTNSQSYKDRNMIGLVTASVVKDGAGTVVSRSEMKYDESGYSPTDYVRGNPTTSRVWDSTKGASTSSSAYIATRARFNTYGNQYEAIDTKGNSTLTTFDSTYQAYPVSVTTIAPDPSGANGSSQAFTTTAVFNTTTGLPTSTVDANGLETRIEYDAVTLRPKNTKTFYQNNQVGSQAETIYNDVPNNYWVKNRAQIDTNKWAESITYFDGLGRAYKTEQIDSNGHIFVEKEFDAQGRVKRVTNPFRLNETKQWTTNVYDEASRIKEVNLPDGATVKTDYGVSTSDAVGITKQITDQAGKKRKGITDALGRMIRVIEDPTGQALPTNYVFDTLGNLRKTIQGEQSRYFNYDSLGRLLYAKQPEQEANTSFSATDAITSNTQWSVKYVYDDNGNIIQTTDARGISVTGTYDKFNRLIYRDYSDSTPDVSFYYDGTGLGAVPAFSKGKTTKVTSSVSETRYTSFDNLGRLLSSEQRTPFSDTETIANATPRTSSYQYNLSGQLMQQTYPSGRIVKSEFDADGALSRVLGNALNQTEKIYANSFSYTTAGAVESVKLGNGKWETAKYNNRLQVEEMGLGNSAADTSLLKLEFDYGTSTQNNGSMLEQKMTVPSVGTNQGFTATQTYTYDSLNRLESATENVPSSQTWKQTFQYDRYGNRRYNTDNSNTTTLGSCSQAVCNPLVNTSDNRFSAGQGYDYDKNGNLTLDAENQRFVYDAESKQTQFFKGTNNSSTPDATYLYDGDGKRVKKISYQETTVFVYDGSGQLVAEYSTQISATPQTSYLTQDHLGSPRVTTNQLGAVISRRDFRAFGEEALTAQRTSGLGYDPLSQKNQPEEARQGYTGYQKDEESGLEYAQARYYNSSHGRFTSVDPLTASASIRDPQTFNRYSYVLNSPYKFTDPLGLLPIGSGACGQWCTDAPYVDGSAFRGRDTSFDWAQPIEASPTNEGVVANHEAPHSTQQEAGEAEPPPAPAPETTTQVGTVIIAYGQPGLVQNVGENFKRAASTMQEHLESVGVKVINVGEIGSFNGFQNVLDTAAKNKASAIYLFTHGASVALDIGDGPRNDTKDVTMKNVNKLYNSNESLTWLIIHGCNVGSVDNGIGQALANQLKTSVMGTTTGQSFSSSSFRLTNGNGKHPDTGPTYMVPEGKGKWRTFNPNR